MGSILSWLRANWIPMAVGASAVLLGMKLPIVRNLLDLWRGL